MTAYAERTDVELIFGKSNVSKWADVDNDGNEDDIDARITWALTQGYEYINDRLREGPYAIPFILGATLPETVKRMNAAYTGVILYESRGVTDVDSNGKAMHALRFHKEWVDDTIKKIFARQIRFALSKTYTDTPMVVRDDDTDQISERVRQRRVADIADEIVKDSKNRAL